jgi:predicted ATP-grasp superfamily ATP-dependent carboligase
MPATDAAVLIVARHGAELSTRFRIANPTGGSIERALGKAPFARHAEQHGIPIPRTSVAENLDEIRRAARELSAPFVLKPDIKTERWTALAGAKVFIAEDGLALERVYERCREWSDRFVVQEWIEGGDDAVYSYYAFIADDRRVIAECVGHKLRQWPPGTGSGTLSEFCDDPEILETGRALLESLDHRGFATVNMKRDSATGKLFVIEANVGRPGMGMFVAEAAGIEMTYLAYRSLAGLAIPPTPPARFPNARWVCLKRDLAAAIAAWRRGELGLAAYLRSLRGVRRCAVFALRDPLPFFHDVLRLPRQLAQRQPRIHVS